jgi:hypothetical protein
MLHLIEAVTLRFDQVGDGNSEEGEGDSIAPSATPDKAEARAEIKQSRRDLR